MVIYTKHFIEVLGIGSGGGKSLFASTAIGIIGMWLGLIMASHNVWFIIWPNQKKEFWEWGLNLLNVVFMFLTGRKSEIC